MVGILSALERLETDYEAGGTGWRQGDWLINDEAGFVRRGFLGSLLLTISDRNGAHVLRVLQGLQAGLLVLFFAGFLASALRLGVSDRVLLTLSSPAALLFWTNDPRSALRKELLVYGGLSILLLHVAFVPQKRWWRNVALAFFCAGVLAHEGTLFFLPVIFLVFTLLSRSEGKRWPTAWITGTLVGAGVLGAGQALLWSNSVSPDRVCRALRERGLSPRLCEGAVSAIADPPAKAIDAVVRAYGDGSGMVYLVAYLAAIVPLLLLWPQLARRAPLVLLGGALLFGPLFVVGLDWGRWINFYFVSLSTLLLLERLLAPERETKAATLPIAAWLGLLLFNLAWTIPNLQADWPLWRRMPHAAVPPCMVPEAVGTPSLWIHSGAGGAATEVVLEMATLDPRLKCDGWSTALAWDDGQAFRYVHYPQACVAIPVAAAVRARGWVLARSPRRIKGQRLSLTLNGYLLADTTLPNEWTEIPFEAPRHFWRSGKNHLCLTALKKRPGDEGDDESFAAAVVRVRLARLPDS